MGEKGTWLPVPLLQKYQKSISVRDVSKKRQQPGSSSGLPDFASHETTFFTAACPYFCSCCPFMAQTLKATVKSGCSFREYPPPMSTHIALYKKHNTTS